MAEAWVREYLVEAEAEAAPTGVPFRVVALAYLAECEQRIVAGDLRETTFRRYRHRRRPAAGGGWQAA